MFYEATPSALYRAVVGAIECYRDGQMFRRIQLTGMGREIGWRNSAQRYIVLYKAII